MPDNCPLAEDLNPKSDLATRLIGFSSDNRWFIRAALVYLMAAGIGLVFNGSLLSDDASRPAAMHLFTLGFMMFLIYGLGAHMLPRFTGRPIADGIWPWLQMGLAHAGVLGYGAGFLTDTRGLALAGAACAWAALWIFALRAWRVMWGGR